MDYRLLYVEARKSIRHRRCLGIKPFLSLEKITKIDRTTFAGGFICVVCLREQMALFFLLIVATNNLRESLGK